MNPAKKWMATLADEEYEWIKETAEETELSGSEVIRESIRRHMKDKAFKASLVEAKHQIRLRELTDKKTTLEEEIKALRNKVGERAYA